MARNLSSAARFVLAGQREVVVGAGKDVLGMREADQHQPM